MEGQRSAPDSQKVDSQWRVRRPGQCDKYKRLNKYSKNEHKCTSHNLLNSASRDHSLPDLIHLDGLKDFVAPDRE
jgi:hypothetical protein